MRIGGTVPILECLLSRECALCGLGDDARARRRRGWSLSYNNVLDCGGTGREGGGGERGHTCFDSLDFSSLLPLLKRLSSFFLTSLMAQFPRISI